MQNEKIQEEKIMALGEMPLASDDVNFTRKQKIITRKSRNSRC